METKTPLILLFICVLAPNLAAQQLATSCDRSGTTVEQLKCEVKALAGPTGRRYPESRIFEFLPDSPEPVGSCYEEILPKNLSCHVDANGDDSCVLTVGSIFNCGACAGFALAYACKQVKGRDEPLCRIDDVSVESGSGEEIDDAKLKEIISELALADIEQIERKYVAYAGSYLDEMNAYRVGHSILETGIWLEQTQLYVTQAKLAGKTWYRLFLTEPTTRENAEKACGTYREKIPAIECSIMRSLVYNTRSP